QETGNKDHPRDDKDASEELDHRQEDLRAELAEQLLLEPVVFLQLAEHFRQTPGLLAHDRDVDKQRRKKSFFAVEGFFQALSLLQFRGNALGDGTDRSGASL